MIDMITNATPSIKSEVKNLSSLDPSLHYNDVAMAISEEYSKAYTARQQPHLRIIDPSDNQQFPGIDNFANELKGDSDENSHQLSFVVPFRVYDEA
ncbi:Lipoyltransferase 1, mitochondrial [Exaiptasia diaphana]|nr:Lipoyltransferase 1, mitochondrial [Exaiptasia diaphana]